MATKPINQPGAGASPAQGLGDAKRVAQPARITKLRDKSAKLRAEIAELRQQHLIHLKAARDTANEANDKAAQVALIERDLDSLQYGPVAVEGN